MKRAQISVETVMAVSLVVLIFLGFFIFYIEKNREIKNLDDALNLRDECFEVSNAIQHAITLGEGYTTELSLSTNVTININGGIISIEYTDGIDTTQTSCSYRGDVGSGAYSGAMNITNKDNSIIIQNV